MLGPYRVRRARSLSDDEDTGEDTGGDTGGEVANLEAVNQAITAAIAAHRALPNDHYDHSLIADTMARQSAAANANLIAALAARVATLEAGRLTRDNLMQGDNITLTPGTSDREVTISAAGGGFAPVELVNANFDFSSIGFVISLTAATTWKDYDWLIIDWGETLITGDNDVYGAFWVRVAKIESLERILTSAVIDANGQGNFARFELPNGQEFVLGRTALDGLAGATTGA